MKKYSLVIKIIALCLLSDIFETLAQIFFKSGTNAIGAVSANSVNGILAFVQSGIVSPFIWLGILSLVMQFFIWMAVLAKSDLHFAFIVSSTQYIMILLSSRFLFNEYVSPLRWLGALIIILGITLASHSYTQDTQRC